MKENNPYRLPLNINPNREVAAEEMTNMLYDIPNARVRLEKYAMQMAETGTPYQISYDDLDADTVKTVDLDWQMVEVIDYAIMKGQDLLARYGVIFEQGYEGGDD